MLYSQQRVATITDGFDYYVAYENATTKVVIEGTNYGFAVQVKLGPKGDLFLRKAIPWWALLRAKSVTEEFVSGQLNQLHQDARLLRKYAASELKGDFSLFDAARSEMQKEIESAKQPTRRKLP